MATELLLRIQGINYYIVSADRLHPDQVGNIINAPSSVLNPCAFDTTCMSRLKQFLSQSTSAFDARTMSNSDIIERAKQQIYQSRGRYYLVLTRKQLRLDFFDDNLSAAERYMEGQEANYNEHHIAASGALKSLRDINVGGLKPFEIVFGRNGSQAIEFVTRWGMLGVFDLNNKITLKQRIQRGGES
jgi:hypothetical protein